MRKVIYEDKIKTRVLTPSIPAVVETYKESIPRTVWDCDFCDAKSGDSIPECLGCGKAACYWCKNKGAVEDLWFEIGDSSYNDCIIGAHESDDFRQSSFYLCKDCKKNPPEKIKMLMKYVTNLEDLWKEEYDLKIVVMNEIEKVKKDE